MFASSTVVLLVAAGLVRAAPLPAPGLLGGAGGGLLGGTGDGLLGGGALLGGGRAAGEYYGYPSHGAGGGGLLPGAGLLADVGSGHGQPIGLIGKRGGLLGGGLLGGGTDGLLAGGLGSGGGLLGGNNGGILSGSTSPLHLVGPRTPGLPLLGSSNGGRLTSLGGNHDLLSNGDGLLGIGEPQGLANTGLLSGGSKYRTGGARFYEWAAPQGWAMPAWYEFGYYHPDSGAWVYDQPSVLSFLVGRGYSPIEHYSPATYVPQPLFNSAWDHPARAVDLTRGGQYGYWGADQTFIAVDADVSNLLGSCGYYRPTYY